VANCVLSVLNKENDDDDDDGRQEVCFKAKIGLTGLIVNSKAKNLNSKPGPRRLKSFRLHCQSKDVKCL